MGCDQNGFKSRPKLLSKYKVSALSVHCTLPLIKDYRAEISVMKGFESVIIGFQVYISRFDMQCKFI